MAAAGRPPRLSPATLMRRSPVSTSRKRPAPTSNLPSTSWKLGSATLGRRPRRTRLFSPGLRRSLALAAPLRWTPPGRVWPPDRRPCGRAQRNDGDDAEPDQPDARLPGKSTRTRRNAPPLLRRGMDGSSNPGRCFPPGPSTACPRFLALRPSLPSADPTSSVLATAEDYVSGGAADAPPLPIRLKHNPPVFPLLPSPPPLHEAPRHRQKQCLRSRTKCRSKLHATENAV